MRGGRDVTYRTDMEAAFEDWFQARRRESWVNTLGPTEQSKPVPEQWSMGLRSTLHEGWMGAVLWCRLCSRQHEGPCFTHTSAVKEP